jgi:hypothetical protein
MEKSQECYFTRTKNAIWFSFCFWS